MSDPGQPKDFVPRSIPMWARTGDSAGGYAEGGYGEGGYGEGGYGEGGSIHIHGLTPGQGLAIAGIAAAALGISIVNMVMDSSKRADMLSRYEESITELRDELRINRNETKQLQIQVMDSNALALRNGWRQPGDDVYGPAGNLEYRPPLKRPTPAKEK